MGNLPVENALRAEGGTVAGAALYRGALEVDGEVSCLLAGVRIPRGWEAPLVARAGEGVTSVLC